MQLVLLHPALTVPQRQRFISSSSGGAIDADKYVAEALNARQTEDQRLEASNDGSSPSAAAAMAYMAAIGKDGLCGKPSEVYIKEIFSGKSKEEANAAATRVYIEAYNNGERLPQRGACAAAEVAWKDAWRKGDDPVLESAQAFINAWPGTKEGNPCALAGIAYFRAIIAGKSHLDANKQAMKSFSKAFKNLANRGKPLKDSACKAAAKAFYSAIPVKPDPANAAAFVSFMDKIFDDNAPAYDPVCLASLEAFVDSYSSGDDLSTSNLKAARAFFKEFAQGSSFPSDSPCAEASISYASNSVDNPNSPNAAAMIAYITEAIRSKISRKLDPVCAAAAEAYFDAYIDQKSEAAANEAAAVAYIESLDKYPNFDTKSPCGKAASAYIKEL